MTPKRSRPEISVTNVKKRHFSAYHHLRSLLDPDLCRLEGDLTSHIQAARGRGQLPVGGRRPALDPPPPEHPSSTAVSRLIDATPRRASRHDRLAACHPAWPHHRSVPSRPLRRIWQVGDVLLQFLLFFPGLALFSEFIALGNEYSRMQPQQQGMRLRDRRSVRNV